jgi:glycerophosphoryl diester phosphodiesterase
MPVGIDGAASVFSTLMNSWPLIVSLVLIGCAAQVAGTRPPTPFAGVNGPLIIAHRGGSLEAPENTVASVRHGVSVGSDWQEIDVTLTADDQVVLMHDDTLTRTTGGQGRPEDMKLVELEKLVAGKPRWSEGGKSTLAMFGVMPPDFGERFAKERVPTLDDILAIADARLMIEMKKTDRGRALVDKVIDAVHRHRAADRVALGSFEQDLLDYANQRDPSIPLIGILEEQGDIEKRLMLPVSVLAVRMDLIEEALQAAPAGVAVWAWTAYNLEMAEKAIERGAHGVIADCPTALVHAWRTPQSLTVELSKP